MVKTLYHGAQLLPTPTCESATQLPTVSVDTTQRPVVLRTPDATSLSSGGDAQHHTPKVSVYTEVSDTSARKRAADLVDGHESVLGTSRGLTLNS